MATAARPLRPMGIGDLIDETFKICRQHLALFARVSAVLLVPYAILQLVPQLLSAADPETLSPLAILGIALAGIAVFLLLILSIATYAALTFAISEVIVGRPVTASDAYQRARQRYLPVLGLSIVYGLAIVLMMVTIVGIPAAIYFGVAWAVSFPVIVIEQTRVLAALGRSRALVRGNWWRVLGTLIMLGLIGFVVSLVLSLPMFLFTILAMLFEPGSIPAMTMQALGALVSAVGSLVTGVVAYCAIVLLYYDLRVRKEGFDLELLARQLDADRPALSPPGQ